MDSATRAWTQAFHAILLCPSERIQLSGVECTSEALAGLRYARFLH
jgi:hypothetical protein